MSDFNFVKYSGQACNGNSVIRHRHVLFLSRSDSVEHIFASEHAGSAMNDQAVGGEVFRKIVARHHINLQSPAYAFAQHVRNLHPADILCHGSVGARFGYQHA